MAAFADFSSTSDDRVDYVAMARKLEELSEDVRRGPEADRSVADRLEFHANEIRKGAKRLAAEVRQNPDIH